MLGVKTPLTGVNGINSYKNVTILGVKTPSTGVNTSLTGVNETFLYNNRVNSYEDESSSTNKGTSSNKAACPSYNSSPFILKPSILTFAVL